MQNCFSRLNSSLYRFLGVSFNPLCNLLFNNVTTSINVRKTLTNKKQKTPLYSGKLPARVCLLSLVNVRSLGKSHPPSSSQKRRPCLSSTLAYKFIRKLPQFKCPRCFNQGASPFSIPALSTRV